MLNELKDIVSIINNNPNAKDKDNAFTFIEFIKEYGYENTNYSFLVLYKDYLATYATTVKETIAQTTEEYVTAQMVEILKSITLTYSSYEEQRWIKNLDWSDINQVRSTIPFYSRKIQEICEFYRRKRVEAPLIVKKNNLKGSKKGLEQVIYDKIFDFMFNNKNLQPQIAEIQRDLTISIENYVDTYSDYFDIPRDTELQDKDRMYITANMNDVDYKAYLEINNVINDIIYTGKVYLEEIPLIANLALDLTQECVGEMLSLKQDLIARATINIIPLTEQVALKRRLYEKFLGCDLWYLYCDSDKTYQYDILCKAKNPTGNLLNCGSADTATTPGNEYKTLSQIGLFFKPEKLSFLKVNSKDFTWEVDESCLEEGTMYVFPDPNKYGDIGNSKISDYPLMILHNLDYDISNLSLGMAKNDPLVLLEESGWNSYYSKQQDDFKIKPNDKFQYAFSSLANAGLLYSYQTDIYGNEFGLFKGVQKTGPVTVDGKTTYTITIVSNSIDELKYPDLEDDNTNGSYILINGGYFKDPFNEEHYFDYTRNLTLTQYYNWVGISIGEAPFVLPEGTVPHISFGTNFDVGKDITFEDHFGVKRSISNLTETGNSGTGDFTINNEYLSLLEEDEEKDYEIIIKKEYLTTEELEEKEGELKVKSGFEYGSKIMDFWEAFDWVSKELNEKIIRYSLLTSFIAVETNKRFLFLPYSHNGEKFISESNFKPLIIIVKNASNWYSEPFYSEKENMFYLVEMVKEETDNISLQPNIIKIDVENYERIDFVKFDKLNKNGDFNEGFIIPYSANCNVGKILFTHNATTDNFLLAYMYKLDTFEPFIYEHIFKLKYPQDFVDTCKTRVYRIKNNTIIIFNDKAVNPDKIYCSDPDDNYSTTPFFQEF